VADSSVDLTAFFININIKAMPALFLQRSWGEEESNLYINREVSFCNRFLVAVIDVSKQPKQHPT